MTYDVLARSALDYAPCRYGDSKLSFRGPKRRLDSPYVAFLGGTEFYGKFINAPVPALVESDLGVNCVNFGQCNAGLEMILNDPVLSRAGSQSQITVLQVLGAQNLSNRLYTVHPRRNDRFVAPSKLLMAMYPEVDFAEFHYNRHMLTHLLEVSASRFSGVRAELEIAWIARMKSVIDRIEGKVVLLWMSDHAPLQQHTMDAHPVLTRDPLFVSVEMLQEVAPLVEQVVQVVVSPDAMAAGTDGMMFNDLEAPVAEKMLGPRAHGEAALALGPVLHDLIGA